MTQFLISLNSGFSAVQWCCLHVTLKRSKVPLTKTAKPISFVMHPAGGVTGSGGVRGDLVESRRSKGPAEEHQRQRPDAAESRQTCRGIVAPHERLLHQVPSQSPASLQNGQNAA